MKTVIETWRGFSCPIGPVFASLRPLSSLRDSMFDATADMISSISADTPDTDITEIVLDSAYLDDDELAGMAIAVPVPDDSNDTWRVGWVEKNTDDTIWVSDPDTYGVYDAIWDTGNSEVVEGFVIYDFRKSVPTECESTVSGIFYDSDEDETLLTLAPCTYLEAGWTVVGDIGTYIILRVESGKWVVEGDVTGDFTLFSAYTATRPNASNFDYKTTGGEWTSAPSYSASKTTLTDNLNANFASHIESRTRRKSEVANGPEWLVQPPATSNAAFVVVAWAGRRLSHPTSLSASRFDVSTTSIKVKGDVTGLTASGERYWIYAPPHIETEHGTIDPDALCYSSKYLWAGYEYVTPMAGFYVDPPGASGLGVYGRQDGSNQAGYVRRWAFAFVCDARREAYSWAGCRFAPTSLTTASLDCWNRTYDPSTARWTTPDPAASPWTNLWSYCGANPVMGTDPSGLLSMGLSIPGGLGKYGIPTRLATDWHTHVGKDVYYHQRVDGDGIVRNGTKFRTRFILNECLLHVQVRAFWPRKAQIEDGVDAAEAEKLKQNWRKEVSDKWSMRFKLKCDDCSLCPEGFTIVVELVFTDQKSDDTYNFKAGKKSNVGQQSMELRKKPDKEGGYAAGHEVGHALGNREEYGKVGYGDNAKDHGKGGRKDGNIMNNPHGKTEAKHYNKVKDSALKQFGKGVDCEVVPVK